MLIAHSGSDWSQSEHLFCTVVHIATWHFYDRRRGRTKITSVFFFPSTLYLLIEMSIIKLLNVSKQVLLHRIRCCQGNFFKLVFVLLFCLSLQNGFMQRKRAILTVGKQLRIRPPDKQVSGLVEKKDLNIVLQFIVSAFLSLLSEYLSLLAFLSLLSVFVCLSVYIIQGWAPPSFAFWRHRSFAFF